MGKPKGRNGFFQFLIHTQNQLKREGKNLGLNSPELQGIAGDKWKGMSKEERAPYEQRSQKSNTQVEISPKKYHENQQNYGKILSRESDQLDDEEDDAEYYLKMIECCVKACETREQIMNASFFIVGTNVMCKANNNEFPPLEISICQYSIAKGIQFVYHEFIDAGRVPLGFMHLAKSHMQAFHKIPLEDFLPAVNNYEKIVEDIKQILEESRFTNSMNGKPTPMMVFCRDDAIPQNKGVFEWLRNKYNANNSTNFEWDIEVLDLVALLNIISVTAQKPIPPALAEDKLNSSAYDYAMNTLCDYHEELDCRHCAQGLAKRLCYMLSEALCPMFEVTPTDKHFPSKRNVVQETYVQSLQEVRPLPAHRYHETAETDDQEWEPDTTEEQTPDPSTTGAIPKRTGVGRGRGRFAPK